MQYAIRLYKGFHETQVRNIANKLTPYVRAELSKSESEEAQRLSKSDEPLIRLPHAVDANIITTLFVDLPSKFAPQILTRMMQQYSESIVRLRMLVVPLFLPSLVEVAKVAVLRRMGEWSNVARFQTEDCWRRLGEGGTSHDNSVDFACCLGTNWMV